MYEPREAGDGTHYVVASLDGHIAHVEQDGDQVAAVGMTADDAAKAADALNKEAHS